MMHIVITRQAEKDMDGITVKDRARIIHKLEIYAANPRALANQVKRLQGRPECAYALAITVCSLPKTASF